MVAIVFLVLYLTKMMPFETPHLMKEVEQKKASQSEVEEETRAVPEETRKEETTTKVPSEMSQEKKIDKMVVSKVEEAKSATASVPKAEAPAVGTPQLKAAEKGKPLLSESGKFGKVEGVERRAYLAAKPPQELILRIADREKALSQLHELIKQFGGEIMKEEGNIVLASLPNASFSEFKKEFAGMDTVKKANQIALRKEAIEDKEAPLAVKQREAEEKEQKPPKPMTDQESRISIRILLVQE
jgi:hypothetical protein